jgi:lysophospholipid acyltransferase
LKLVAVLLSTYVLAQVHALLPYNRRLRELYSLVAGLALGWFLVGFELLHLFGTALVAYALFALLPRERSVVVVVVGVFVYLVFVCHLYQMLTAYMIYKLDFTGSQMLLTLKLSALAFNLYDGRKGADDSAFDAHQRRYRLAQLPDLLTYFSFVFCYLGFYTGPIVEFRDFNEFNDGTLFAALPDRKPTSGRYIAAAKAFVTAIVCAGFLQTLGARYPRAFVLSDEYSAMPLIQRAVIMWVYSIAMRMPYYFGWKLSEGSGIISGLGFSGLDKNGEPEYQRCTNCHVWQVESAQNIKTVTDGWNLGTDHWLKHYVYTRVKLTRFKNYDVAATLTVSAVWHGLYPGYYLSFLTAAIVIQVARLGRRVCRPYFVTADDKPKPTKPLYDALTFIGHQFVFNYTMVPFVMLSFTDGIAFWSSLIFSGHILMIAGYVLFTVLGGSRKSAGGAKPTAATVANGDAKADKVTDMVSKLKHRDTPHPSKAEVRKTAADAASSPYKLRERTPAH